MEHSRLKRFAIDIHRKLLDVTDEITAYLSFMRIGTVLFAERERCENICNMSLSERKMFFSGKCREYALKYGGIFSLYGECDMPEFLLANEIISDYTAVLPENSDTLGWLHQYFNEPNREAGNVGLKNSKRLDSDKIAAATQIFTPNWIVKYLVENTLVRTWYERGGCKLDGYERYLVDKSAAENLRLTPEDITFLDPCSGSGNMLLYAFDVFLEMYRKCGYSDKQAADLIFEKNLFGLELDEKACAVSETALRLKAEKTGSGSFPKVYCFSENDCENAESLGSLLSAENFSGEIHSVLARKYDVIVTNPPYIGKSAMNQQLLRFAVENYKEHCADLFSIFMVRCTELTAPNGRIGFLTPYTWLFIKSFEQLRRLICTEKTLETLVQFAYSAFENAVVPVCAFTFENRIVEKPAVFLRLTDFCSDLEIQREKVLEAIDDIHCPYRYTAKTSDFMKLPSAAFMYWLSPNMRKTFSFQCLSDIAEVREGLITGDNERFLRRWHEVSLEKIAFSAHDDKKWYLLNKGGDFRRWYGNREFVINWENKGEEICSFSDIKGRLRSRPQNIEFNFCKAAGWSAVTSGAMSVRYYDENFMFNVAGACAFPKEESQLIWIIALLNSKTVSVLSQAINPTLNMNPGDTARIPIPKYSDDSQISRLAKECIKLSKKDWDSFEESFDFKRHPLLPNKK